MQGCKMKVSKAVPTVETRQNPELAVGYLSPSVCTGFLMWEGIFMIKGAVNGDGKRDP